MPPKPHTHESLIFAWEARDHSTWHLFVALLVLVGAMAGFFFVFRIVHPVAQRLPTTPQHVISLDPGDPEALALIHRAQDRSFALLSEDEPLPEEKDLLAFRPSFQDHELRLLEPAPMAVAVQQPRLFTAASDVLPPVPPRATPPPPVQQQASLHAVLSPSLARRGPASVVLPDIMLTQPSRVQFRVAVGAAGEIITALPLGAVEDEAVMNQLQQAVAGLRFTPSEVRRIEWGEISFRWEATKEP